MAITSNPVSNESNNPYSISSRWGVVANEYTVDGARVDLQDLMVLVSKKRAAAVEGEVAPQATRIRERNERLDKLGQALADMTRIQASYDSEDDGGVWSLDYYAEPSSETREVLDSLKAGLYGYGQSGDGPNEDGWGYYVTKANCEMAIQLLKSEIDGLNNEAQLDMSRLQQLVDRRDESYSTATNLMTAISDTRANLIRNL